VTWGAWRPGVFSNPVVQRFAVTIAHYPALPSRPSPPDETVEVIPLRAAADRALLEITRRPPPGLDLAEMQAIRAYFQHEGRDPSDADGWKTLAQTWSEHCVHKTFRGRSSTTPARCRARRLDAPSVAQTINGLLRTTIRGRDEKVARPWVRSAFCDNAGVIVFDDEWDLAFKAG